MTTVGTPSFRSGHPVSPSHWDKHETKRHSVQFYQEDSFLLDNLSRLVGAAIASGDAALVIATGPHREGLMQRLGSSGFDVNIPIQQGRFLSLDAADTLARFLVDGRPDPARFEQVIGSVIEQIASALPGNHQIVAFGEMVALLCAEGKTDVAIHLEQLWNQLAGKYSFHLHCAYALSLFPHAHNASQIEEICRLHSHVVPSEHYTSLGSEEERLRAIAVLQQKAQALETEMGKREKIQAALEKREAELTDFLENAVVSMHWVAADGTILWANKAELALLGYQPHEYIGHHIAEFHADNDVIDDILERLQRNEELHGRSARLRCKNGEVRDVRIHSNVCWNQGEFVHTRCFTLDVTDALRSERRIVAQHAITRLLSEVDSLAEVAESILKIICSSSECDLGAVWLVEGDKLRCATIWHSSTKKFPKLEKATTSITFAKGEGLPGRIWATNQPAWIEEVSVDNNLPRLSAALQDGVRSALGFPISTEGGPVGVIEFFATRTREIDEEFLKMMAAVGNQIGQFVQRKKAEQALRESEERFRAIFETTPECVKVVAPDGTLLHMNAAGLVMVGAESPDTVIGKSIYDVIALAQH
jgi:PAS domain S-box-containing protein